MTRLSAAISLHLIGRFTDDEQYAGHPTPACLLLRISPIDLSSVGPLKRMVDKTLTSMHSLAMGKVQTLLVVSIKLSLWHSRWWGLRLNRWRITRYRC